MKDEMKPSLGFRGEICVTKTNAQGDIILQETKHNDIVDATRNKLVTALQDHTYGWSTLSSSVALALDDPNSNSQYYPKKCQNLGGTGNAASNHCCTLMIQTETSDNKVLIKPNSTWSTGAVATGNVIEYEAFLTDCAGTYDYGELGILGDFYYAGAGSLSWHNIWATGDFASAVTIAAADTLTVNWKITVG